MKFKFLFLSLIILFISCQKKVAEIKIIYPENSRSCPVILYLQNGDSIYESQYNQKIHLFKNIPYGNYEIIQSSFPICGVLFSSYEYRGVLCVDSADIQYNVSTDDEHPLVIDFSNIPDFVKKGHPIPCCVIFSYDKKYYNYPCGTPLSRKYYSSPKGTPIFKEGDTCFSTYANPLQPGRYLLAVKFENIDFRATPSRYFYAAAPFTVVSNDADTIYIKLENSNIYGKEIEKMIYDIREFNNFLPSRIEKKL